MNSIKIIIEKDGEQRPLIVNYSQEDVSNLKEHHGLNMEDEVALMVGRLVRDAIRAWDKNKST